MHVCTGGKLRHGQIQLYRAADLAAELRTWRDCNIVLTVERAYATRSVEQNAYYWSVVVERIRRAWAARLRCRVSTADAHEWLKAQFLPLDAALARTNGIVVNGLIVNGSTRRLTTMQFVEYLERIVQFAALKWGVDIPDPDPRWKEKAMAEEAVAAIDGDVE